jgi:hypothetical protein
MSLSKLGITKESVGRLSNFAGSFGKSVNGTLVEEGILLKLTHGTCFRA